MFDGTGAEPRRPTSRSRTGRIVDVGTGPRRRRVGRRRGPDAAARAVRLPHPRDDQPRRPLAARPSSRSRTSSSRPCGTSRRRSGSGSRRSATRAAPTSGSSRPSTDGLIAGPADADLDRHAEPDRRPRRRLAVRRARGAAPRRPSRAARRASSTARTRCGARSASCTGWAPTSSRSRRRGGVLSPRDDPRHAHFRPAELEVLVEEATAAGMFVMAHAQGADGIKNAVRAGIRSIEHGIYLDDEAIELMKRARNLVRADARRAAGRHRRRRRRRPAAAGRRRQGAVRRRDPSRGVPARGRGRRPDRDGHRLRRHAARPEPARARADGRGRDDAGGGARGDDAERRRSSWASTTSSARSSRARSPTSSSSTGDPYDVATLADRIEQVWKAGARVV